eukprot:210316-Amphidinium_carterae.1
MELLTVESVTKHRACPMPARSAATTTGPTWRSMKFRSPSATSCASARRDMCQVSWSENSSSSNHSDSFSAQQFSQPDAEYKAAQPTSDSCKVRHKLDEEPGLEKVPQNQLTQPAGSPSRNRRPGRTTRPNQRSCQGLEGATLLIVAGASHSIGLHNRHKRARAH